MAPKLIVSALLSALALAAPSYAVAASGTPLDVSLIRGGTVAADPVANGSHLYIPTGRVLATWDYTDPSAPLRVATSAPADAAINGLARHGDYLYASWRGYDGSSGVATYSLADPAKPELVDQSEDYVDAGDKFLLGLVIANDHLYLFDNNKGVFVSDLADPAAPEFAATGLTGVPTQYSHITASGNTIYGTGRNWVGGTVLDLYDVSAPELPVQVGSNGANGIDNFSLAPEPGFVLGTGNQLTLYDLNDSGQMSKRGWLEIPAAFTGVHIGDYAYTFGWGAGLDVWNIANIDAPAESGHFDFDVFSARRAMRAGNTLLIPTETDLLQAIDVSAPQQPQLISTSWLPGGGAKDIAIHDGQLVLVQPNYGLTVNDAQTLAPTARFEVDLPKSLEQRSFEQVGMSGDIAWLASWGYGLFGVDLSNPAAPVEIGRLSFPFAAVLDVQGQYAYVAKWTNGGLFGVADISNPASPTLVWQGALANQPYRLTVDGSHAYIAESNESNSAADGGLRVYDLANPAAPVELSHLNDGCGNGYDLAIDSDVSLLYLACGSGVQVIDIANPAAPTVVSRFDTGDSNSQYTHVALRGDRAWFADNAGVHELDVSDPTNPVQTRLTPLGHQGVQRLMAADDGRLFALGGNTGVHVFATDDSAPEATPLENKVPVNGLTGAVGDEQLFAIEVPEGAAMLNILSYGGSGDITLLAKRDGVPSEGDADGRSSRPGNSETIRIRNPAAGTYYIKLVGVKAFKNVTLQARY